MSCCKCRGKQALSNWLLAVSYWPYGYLLTANSQKPKTKKTTNLISRILFLNYHLSGHVITNMILLPTLGRTAKGGVGRAALQRPFTWHYSTQGLPFQAVTNLNRERLPHVFIFAPIARGSYFLWHFLSPENSGCRRLTGRLLCAVRTFLPAGWRNDSSGL